MTTTMTGLPKRRWLAALRHAAVGLILLALPAPLAAAEPAKVSGVLTANGVEVALPYVYVWAEEEGFYDPADPSWRILFVEREVTPRELGEPIWDAAWVELRLTETAEFDDQPKLQVYSQSIKFSADSGGNLSGGEYPQIEIEGLGTEQISGRVYHTETQEFFDDTYKYDLTFSAALTDPNAPIGEPLPDGGGDPGRAYLQWVEAVHTGTLDALRSIVPPEWAEQLDSLSAAEAKEQMEFLQFMTPTDVKILSGSLDGENAFLEIEGMIEGEKVNGEITMTQMGEFWMPTESKM
ncbi:MAG: hypothetical protein AAF495_05045 [Pseudomonadota bacterium]